MPQVQKSAGAGSDGVRNLGNPAWGNPGNITSSNDSRAVCSLDGGAVPGGDETRYLQATSFPFSISLSAVIVGVLATFERQHTVVGGADVVVDNEARLIVAGARAGTSQSAAAVWPSAGSEAEQTIGGATNLWDTTLTPAQVNASNFGVSLVAALQAGGGGNLNDAEVDHVQMTIYYRDKGGQLHRVTAFGQLGESHGVREG